MKIVYIAHPISGDVNGNLVKVVAIARSIALTEPDTIPFAPYYFDCNYLDDNNPHERQRGIDNDKEFFVRRIIDEVRLYGETISSGMKAEIELAFKYGIPVVSMTEGTSKYYKANQPIIHP